MLRLHERLVVASIFAGFGALIIPSLARAATPSLEVTPDTPISIQDDSSFDEVVVRSGGTLKIKAATPGQSIHIKATRIVIESGGVIDGSGNGFQGVENANGNGDGGGTRSGNAGTSGGGASHVSAGGRGTDLACNEIADAAGGPPYADAANPKPGSAGGAANPSPAAAIGTKGGAGGAAVILEAGEIRIDGQVIVNGNQGLSINGVGSGGGAGGAIKVISPNFSLGSAALLSARGGNGGGDVSKGHGGGGSGGIIILFVQDPAGVADMQIEVAGGISGACVSPVGAGGPGTIDKSTPVTACLDLDMDGTLSEGCQSQGGDCDDIDPDIHPGAADICNGQDDDCDGTTDEDPSNCTGEQQCIDGQCRKPDLQDGGVDAGPDADVEAPPVAVEYRGGCGVGNPNSCPFGLAGASLGLLIVLHRIRRGRRG